jgi:hypothetical protein
MTCEFELRAERSGTLASIDSRNSLDLPLADVRSESGLQRAAAARGAA